MYSQHLFDITFYKNKNPSFLISCFRQELNGPNMAMKLHRILAHESKTICSMPKKMGGTWIESCTTLHGGMN